MKTIINLAFLVTSCFLILSCGYSHTKTEADRQGQGDVPDKTGGVPGGNPDGEPAGLDFNAVRTQVLQPYCLRCHSAQGGNKGGINLETFANVKAELVHVKAEVSSGAMPPSGGLATGPKTILLDWINAGALEFAKVTPKPEPGVNSGPQPSPEPTLPPCEQAHARVLLGELLLIDRQLSFDLVSQKLQRRHDDCDEDETDDHDDDHDHDHDHDHDNHN